MRMRRRKPDVMFILAVVIALGVIVTGWSQLSIGDARADTPPTVTAGVQR